VIKSFRNELNLWGTRILFKPLVILTVFVFAYVLGKSASLPLLRGLGISVAALFIFLITIRWMEVGFLVLILASFAVRLEIATGTRIPVNASVIGSIFLLVVWMLGMVVIEREIRLASLRVVGLALGFAIATTISLLIGNIPFFPQAQERASLNAQLGGWSIYVVSMGLFLLVGHRIRDLRWLRTMLWFFLILAGIYLLFRLYPPLFPLRGKVFVPPQSFGSMFWTWLAALAFGQFLFNTDLSKDRRLLLGVLAGLVFFINLTQTRSWLSGWLHPLIAVFVILLLRSWRLGLILTAAAAILITLYGTFLNSQIFNTVEQYSLNSRAATLPIMLELIKASPFLGLGPSNYYYYTPLYPILGWYVRFNSHNNYVDILAQTGLIGLGLVLFLFFELARMGFRLKRRARDGFSRAYAVSAIGGLAAMFVSGFMGDWFLPFLYNIGFRGFRSSLFAWIFLGGLVAIEQIMRRQEAEPKTEPIERLQEA
jgi:O-antigen ligase